MRLSDLPGLRLNPQEDQDKKDSNKSKKEIIQKIENMLKDMKENKYRTTNFAIILYIIEKHREKVLLSELKEHIKKDFQTEKKIFISSSSKKPFTSEKQIFFSINGSISRNKSFKKEIKDKDRYISLVYENVLAYLEKMYHKYKSDNIDITSISSEKSDDGFSNQKEIDHSPIKLIGHKTYRTKKKTRKQLENSLDSSFDSEISEKNYSEVKNLKKNLRSNPSSDINLIVIDEDNENNENAVNLFSEDFPFFKNKSGTKFASDSKEKIENLISSMTFTKNILDSYIKNLESINEKIEKREEKLRKYEENKANVRNLKDELNNLYEILDLKLDLLKTAKNKKFFGDTFEKNKINATYYKNISFTKIEALKKSLNQMESLENEIIEMNKDINNSIESVKKAKNEKKFLGQKEVKKECENLSKEIKKEKENIENCNGYEFGDKNNYSFSIVQQVIEKFNNLNEQIMGEKEEEVDDVIMDIV